MIFDDLVKHFNTKNKAEIGRLLGVSRSYVDLWSKNGIPYLRQLVIEKQTDGKLEAKNEQ